MGFIKNALVDGDTSIYGYGRTMSFPSSFNKGGNQLNLQGMKASSLAKAQMLMAGGELISSGVNTLLGKKGSVDEEVSNSNIKSVNINLSSTLRQQMYDDAFINYGRYNKRPRSSYPGRPPMMKTKEPLFEELHLPGEFIRSMNSYNFSYRNDIWNNIGVKKTGIDTGEHFLSATKAVPSLFNPKYGIQSVGIMWNVPLLNDEKNFEKAQDLSDCSIKHLVALSNKGLLGAETFRLADFMYCKDLGKVSNNNLIVLRKFPLPVGDHIGQGNAPGFRADTATEAGINNSADVAHMITWFGTEDNKLEDILKFSYEVDYIEKESKIQQLDSKEDQVDRGPMGTFINTFSGFLGGDYYKWVGRGTHGTQNLWTKMLGGTVFNQPIARDAGEQLNRYRNYDNNKVYEPMNTLREMSMPSGKLKFNHEFTINFKYRLRAYDNINPRSAFLDLIGNILECTYNRGRWWGGRQKIVGPSPNTAAWNRAQNFIDNAWDKLGGFITAISLSGTSGLKELMGAIANAGSEILNQAKDGAQQTVSSIANGGWGAAAAALSELVKKGGLGIFAKSVIHNALGRPAFYAFDSILSGEPTGVWHVTIGNPLSPIVQMGNLRITNTTFSIGGPLGIDGFPSEINVAVSLKHCHSRDVTNISKMFGNGLSAIYYPTAGRRLSLYYTNAVNNSTGIMNENVNDDKRITKPYMDEDGNKHTFDASEETYAEDMKMAKEQAFNGDLAQAALMKTNFSFAMWQTGEYTPGPLRIGIDEVA